MTVFEILIKQSLRLFVRGNRKLNALKYKTHFLKYFLLQCLLTENYSPNTNSYFVVKMTCDINHYYCRKNILEGEGGFNHGFNIVCTQYGEYSV